MTKDKQQSHPMHPAQRFWILGAGRFGRIARERIHAKWPDAGITVIDKLPIDIASDSITAIRRDGIEWLGDMLHPGAPVDMIVPAIPIHVALEWIVYKIKKKYTIHPINIPSDGLMRWPHPRQGRPGQLFVSQADFVCPDNCPEPDRICTVTGQPRPMDLHRRLAAVDFENVLPIVLQSHQILPGVGGIRPQDLLDALVRVRRNAQRSLMIATACRCHGVIDFLRLGVRPSSAQ